MKLMIRNAHTASTKEKQVINDTSGYKYYNKNRNSTKMRHIAQFPKAVTV